MNKKRKREIKERGEDVLSRNGNEKGEREERGGEKRGKG